MAFFSNPQKFLTITGVNALVGDLIREAASAPERMDKIAAKHAERIARDAKALAPRGETGDLANSISSEKINQGHYIIGPEVFYAHFVEYGTVKMAPQPFMTPAANRHIPKFESECQQQAAKEIT